MTSTYLKWAVEPSAQFIRRNIPLNSRLSPAAHPRRSAYELPDPFWRPGENFRLAKEHGQAD